MKKKNNFIDNMFVIMTTIIALFWVLLGLATIYIEIIWKGLE